MEWTVSRVGARGSSRDRYPRVFGVTLYVSICCPLFTFGLTVQVLGGGDDLKVLWEPLSTLFGCFKIVV